MTRGDPHVASLEVVAAAAVALALAIPRRRGAGGRDRAMQAAMLRVAEEGVTRTERLPLPITIGRAPSATLIARDAQVSRLHARIELSGDQPTIRDLGSRNGTLVNARPIDVVASLVDGDEIDVGTTRVVFLGMCPWT